MISCRQEVLDSVILQRQRFEIARGREKGQEMMDLLLLALYSNVPPSRAREIRTLRYFEETADSAFVLRNFPQQNILVAKENGCYVFHFQDYKTSKYTCHDQVPVEVSIVHVVFT